MKKMLTMSLPAKPQEKTNIGMLIAPILMELIGNKTNSDKMITLNTLHTYSEKNIYTPVYLADLKKFGINYDFFLNDSEQKEQLMSILKELIRDGYVHQCTKELYCCSCGKVDFLKEGLAHGNGKLYSSKSDGIYCNYCNSKVNLINANVLVIRCVDNDKKVRVIPKFLQYEMNYFNDLFSGKEILISKQRNTGQVLIVNNQSYNIDIEFIWSQLYGIGDNNKIMIASNHQVYVMFMMNLMSKYYGNSDNIFVLSPYMNNETKFLNFDEKLNNSRPLVKKIFLIYSLNWKKKLCSWDYGLFKQINRLSDIELEELYQYTCKPIKYENLDDLEEKLSLFFSEELKFDKALKQLKSSHN